MKREVYPYYPTYFKPSLIQDEFKALKEKFSELENERSEKKAIRVRNVSGDIDFSDPFLCEMEIGRLTDENQALHAQLEELSSKVFYFNNMLCKHQVPAIVMSNNYLCIVGIVL